jgi:hypothetical protein
MLPVDPGRFSGAQSLGEATPKNEKPVTQTGTELGESPS